MKIELECEHCRTLLRLDREHAGKQFRCPACGNLSVVPDQTIPVKPTDERPATAEGKSAPSAHRTHSTDWADYAPPPVYRAPRRLDEYPVDQFSGGSAGFAFTSLACGILGLVFAFTCFCISPIIANVGIVLAFHARGAGFWIGLLVNFIALLAWFFMLATVLFPFFW